MSGKWMRIQCSGALSEESGRARRRGDGGDSSRHLVLLLSSGRRAVLFHSNSNG